MPVLVLRPRRVGRAGHIRAVEIARRLDLVSQQPHLRLAGEDAQVARGVGSAGRGSAATIVLYENAGDRSANRAAVAAAGSGKVSREELRLARTPFRRDKIQSSIAENPASESVPSRRETGPSRHASRGRGGRRVGGEDRFASEKFLDFLYINRLHRKKQVKSRAEIGQNWDESRRKAGWFRRLKPLGGAHRSPSLTSPLR